METHTQKLRTAFMFCFILFLAILSRVVYLNPSIFSMARDDAMVCLAALHWANGSDFPLISYGQAYLGTLEAIVAALFFKLFGFGMISLRCAPLFFSLAYVVVVYFFGKDLLGKRFGLIAMAFAAIPAPYLSIWSVAVKGGYPETLFFGTLLLWLAFKSTKTSTNQTFLPLFIGLAGGLAWWCHPLSIYYLVPTALYLGINWFWNLKLGSFLLQTLKGFIGFFIGSLPFWIFNIQNHFKSFSGGGGFHWSEMGIGIKNFFTLAIPSVFSLFPIFSGITGELIRFVIILLFITSLLFCLKRPLFLLFGLSVLFFYSTNQFGIQGETRYVLFLYSLIPFSLAWLSELIFKKNRFAGMIPIFILLFYNSFLIIQDAKARHLDGTNNIRFVKESMKLLEQAGITHILSNSGPVISTMTEEKLISAEPRNARYPLHTLEVDATDQIAIYQSEFFQDLTIDLRSQELSFKMFSNPHALIYYDFQAPVEKLREIPSNDWKVSSKLASETASSAIDRNLAWTWTAAELKRPGQIFTLNLNKTQPVRLIRIYNGKRFEPFPAGLKVEASKNGKTWKEVYSVDHFQYLYRERNHPFWDTFYHRLDIWLSGKPIKYLRFTQTGNSLDKIWEINEIYCYKSLGDSPPESETDFENLVSFLKENEIKNLYAGRTLSAKIHFQSKGKIKTIQPLNEKYIHNPLASRKINFLKNWAFLFDNEESISSETLLKKLKINFEKKKFGPYILFYSTRPSQTNLEVHWTGFSVILDAPIPPSSALSSKITPKNKVDVTFNQDLTLLGYTIQNEKLHPGSPLQISYFWNNLKPIKEDWAVFVHFEHEGNIFQNDHAFYHGTFPLKAWTPGQLMTETYNLSIPKNFPKGKVEIYLGLVDLKKKRSRVPITSSQVPTKSKRALIGQFNITSSDQ